MRHLRRTLLIAAGFTLLASSPAGATSHGAIVVPTGSHLQTLILKTFIELPSADNPVFGDGQNPCVRFGPGGKTLVAVTLHQVTCTAELGTAVNIGVVHFCSSFDPPDSPFYAVGRREGRECARRNTPETAVRVTVDGGAPVNLVRPWFATYSPRTTVRLPADNPFGVPAQTATFSGFGWSANVHNLWVGRHLIRMDVEVDGRTFTSDRTIDIVRRGATDEN